MHTRRVKHVPTQLNLFLSANSSSGVPRRSRAQLIARVTIKKYFFAGKVKEHAQGIFT
jgi:hypothetical protein